MVIYSSSSFLSPVGSVICLYTSSILMPASIFVLSSTVRQVSIDQLRDVMTLYVLGVKVATSFLGISTSLLAHVSAIFWPKKLICWILMIMGILSSFGAMMSISTIFFKSNWNSHIEAMRHIMFLVAEIVIMVTAMVLSVKIALRFKSPEEFENCYKAESFIIISGVLIAALLLLASITSFVGFIIGIYVNTQLLRESTVVGGGLYSGFMGILIGILYLTAVKLCKPKAQLIIHPIIIMLGVLDFVGAITSFFTEELELSATIDYIRTNQLLSNEYIHYKIFLLSKSTLVMLSSLFMAVFICPMIVSCYLLTYNFNSSNNLQSVVANGNDSMIRKYQNKCANLSLERVLKQQYHLDSLEISAMTATTSGLNVDIDER